MKKLRNSKPGYRKRQRRQQAQEFEKQAAAFLDHSMECCACKAPFERTQETVKEWHVVVRSGRVRLACPDCWRIINETLEKENV